MDKNIRDAKSSASGPCFMAFPELFMRHTAALDFILKVEDELSCSAVAKPKKCNGCMQITAQLHLLHTEET